MPDAAGHEAMCDAVAAGDARRLRALARADRTAAAHWKPVMDAAFAGRADLVAILLDAGADPDVVAGTPARHTPLARALHLAVQQGVRGTWLAALLAAGVKPQLRDAAGKTALDYARSTNHRAALALLA